MLGVFYVLLVLPQKRQQKKRQEMMRQLGSGAKIVSTSGIYGTIVAISDDVMRLKVADGIEMEMDPRAVMRVLEPAPQAVQEA